MGEAEEARIAAAGTDSPGMTRGSLGRRASSRSGVAAVCSGAVATISRCERVAFFVLVALATGAGACTLPEVRGRVIDRDSGGAIAGAIVFERFEKAAVLGAPPTTLHARFAESDAAGGFAFASGLAPPRLPAQGRYPPRYGFAHPDYGLVRGVEAPAEGAALVLRGSRGAIAERQALATLCESPPREEWERTIRERACGPPRPSRPADAR